MSAGRLTRLIQVQEQTITTDAEGRWDGTWATVCSPWAAIEPQSGIETQQAGEEQMVLSATFRIRWRSGITPAMRVLYGDRVFGIVGIANPREANEWLVLSCTEERSTAG